MAVKWFLTRPPTRCELKFRCGFQDVARPVMVVTLVLTR